MTDPARTGPIDPAVRDRPAGVTPPAPRPRLAVEYVLPLRWLPDEDPEELTNYLHRLSTWLDVTVVDGSDDDVFARHDLLWLPTVRHIRPESWPGRNGKVAGVVTGLRMARHERAVIADDDVRWDLRSLTTATALLDAYDLVRPQNFFEPLPWHARWDTARSLLNRAFEADYPGTYAVRRSSFLRMGGYDGDVLFENLELSRTLAAAGGREICADSLFVTRRPPTAQHFLQQRVRQAYDDLAQPGRLVTECALLPTLLGLLATQVTSRESRRTVVRLGLLAAGTALVLLAEYGRRRADGRAVFPASAALWAPLWLLERAVCIWIALGQRLAGGMPYAGQRIKLAAHSGRFLRAHRRPPLSRLGCQLIVGARLIEGACCSPESPSQRRTTTAGQANPLSQPEPSVRNPPARARPKENR